MTYSSEETSSIVLIYKQSSSIKSALVGLTYGERTDDCDRPSSSDDSIKSDLVGLIPDGEMANDCEKISSFEEFDVLIILWGSIQNHTILGVHVGFVMFQRPISYIIIIQFWVD